MFDQSRLSKSKAYKVSVKVYKDWYATGSQKISMFQQ